MKYIVVVVYEVSGMYLFPLFLPRVCSCRSSIIDRALQGQTFGLGIKFTY